jgi:16S rRNA (cytosine967-C5)-methyltransferase
LLAVQMLDPRPGEHILDLCAAPGGKTTYLAQRMQNQGRIVAEDVEPSRLQLVRENCTRLGVTCVETRLADAQAPLLGFDRVLVDAPCSNTGVMRRRVGLRWRIHPEEIQRLPGVQLGLLVSAARRVRPGGMIVYSTCSLEPEENAEVVGTFIAGHPDFRLDSERTLLAFREGVDGAYVARLVRENSSAT